MRQLFFFDCNKQSWFLSGAIRKDKRQYLLTVYIQHLFSVAFFFQGDMNPGKIKLIQ